MKLSRNLFFLFVLGCSLISCKKENSTETQQKTTLPNYGNVDLDDVFKNKDSKLKNKDSIVSAIDDYYQKVWEKGDLWGGFLVAKGDQILYESYRGFAQDNQQVPINDTVALHVASISKSITAMATMKLVEAGQLKLDDPLTKFFPKFPYPEVTVFTLLSQRSGLPKYEHFIEKIQPQPAELTKKYITNQDVLNLLIRYQPELARPTNTGFMYCNTNFALLALIIEKVTKNSFPVAMQKMIFQPLKMKHSYIFQPKDSLRAAQSFYNRGNRPFPNDKLDWIYGDKNCYTTPRDLFNFSKAMFSEKFLRKSLKDSIFQPYSNERPGVNNYGMGFRMKNFDNGERLIYHNGWWHGSNSSFSHLLKSKVTIIAIGNRFSSRVYSALALSGLFEDFPPEKEKLAKVLSDEKEQPKEISEPKEVSGDVTE